MYKLLFKKWFLAEDLRPTKQKFITLCRNKFPGCDVSVSIDSVNVHVYDFFGKSILIAWRAGGLTTPKDYHLKYNYVPLKDGISNDTESYIEIDFYYEDARVPSTGNVPVNVDPNSISFAKGLMEFISELKKLNIDILFGATTASRADAYAKAAQKAGYKLAYYAGNKQFWKANFTEEPNENPYKTKQDFAIRKSIRKIG